MEFCGELREIAKYHEPIKTIEAQVSPRRRARGIQTDSGLRMLTQSRGEVSVKTPAQVENRTRRSAVMWKRTPGCAGTP